MEIILSSEFHLTPIDVRHTHDYLLHFNNVEVSKWVPRPLYPYILHDFQEWIKKLLKNRKNQELPRHFVVENKEKEFLGFAGFPRIYEAEPHCSEIFIWLKASKMHQGLGRMVLDNLCTYGSEQLGLSRLEALIMSENISAEKLLKTCSFLKEGELVKKFLKDTHYYNALMYSRIF